MADCDGDADELLAHMAQKAGGLRSIFDHCEGFKETADLPAWLRAHRIRPMASYVNWVGRSVVQIGKRRGCTSCCAELARVEEREPQRLFAQLRESVVPWTAHARPPTPLAWRIRNGTIAAPAARRGGFAHLFHLIALLSCRRIAVRHCAAPARTDRSDRAPAL